jgi:hypothetical protein
VKINHDHPGDALTIGCPACIRKVERDQANAAWRDAPVRRCTWTFKAHNDRSLTFTLDVRVPAGVEPWEVDEWYCDLTGEAISDALAEARIDDDGAFYWACETIRCTIGPVVPEIVVSLQPDLFGGAA